MFYGVVIMKYKEIIGLKEGYHPVYNLENEIKNKWKMFVPNQNFYDVLKTTLNSLNPSSSDYKKKSIWIRGTYGTGKTHATSVIKHLLWEDLTEIEEFVSDLDVHYKNLTNSFRKEKKVFPVIIIGASNIIDNRSFSTAVQKAVTKALLENNIELKIKNDFETAIKFIEENKAHIDWESRIEEDDNLSMYVKNKEDLINRLKDGDSEILQILEKSSSEAGYNLHIHNITDWLKDIVKELRNKKIADYLMIYWDEFTSILELEQKGVSTSEWQNVAELAPNDYVYLFLVSHKFPKHYSEEDSEKALDRFNSVLYKMEPLTTYHIVQGAIKKIDKTKWNELKNKYMDSEHDFTTLIKDLTDNEGSSTSNTIMDLFPIHPYSSYLLTFISRYIGSAQRSVFEFLYDEKFGFKNFIENNPNDGLNIYLTPERLWNFFLDDFQDEQKGSVGPIIERYKSNIEKITEKGDNYVNIFKSILLLNILKQEVNIGEDKSGKVQPSPRIIKEMFIGTEYYNSIDEVLNYLNENNIIQKNPFDIYEITGSAVDQKKVLLEVENLKKNLDLLDIYDKYNRRKLEDIFKGDVLRCIKVNIYNADIIENQLINKLHKEFGEARYEIYLSLFVAKDNNDIIKAKEIINNISKIDEFKHIFFVLSEEPLTESEFDRFLQYKARAITASNHEQYDEKSANEEMAVKIVDDWVDRIRKQLITSYFRGEPKQIMAYDLSNYINNNISPVLYSCGIENTPAKYPSTIWGYSKRSNKSVEVTLNSPNREGLNNVTGHHANLKKVLCDDNQEFIVDTNLNLKDDVDQTHPIVKAANEIDTAINNAPPHGFNLGDILFSLSKPPFGFYSNPVNLAAMGFLMRKYVNRFYECGTGHPIDKPAMKNKIFDLFDYWENGKKGAALELRLSTHEEMELIDNLKNIFKIEEEAKGLNEVKWKIRNIIKQRGFPVWVYKEYTDSPPIKTTIDKIHNFIKSIDKEIDEEFINDLLKELEKNKLDLLFILSEKNTSKEGFIKWLSNIKEFKCPDNIKDEVTINNLMEFIRKDLQEEEPSWEEKIVELSIMRWQAHNESSNAGEGNQGGMSGDTQREPLNPDEVKSVQKTLDDFQHTGGELKKVILQVVKEHPIVWDYLKKYFEDIDDQEEN